MGKIDDRDSSIVFSDAFLGQDWSQLGSAQDTTSLTQTKGASAKITFYGTSIAVYGTVATDSVDSGTTSEYIVDGGVGVTYITDPTKEMQYQVKFFQSATLNSGQHTLEVVNETEDGWLSLDFFLVANSTKTSVSSASHTSSIQSSTSSRPSSARHSTVTVAFIPTSTPDMDSSIAYSSSASNHKGPNAGLIVGSVLGGTIGLILLIVLIWLTHRKLADRYADEAAAIPTNAPVPVPSSKTTRNFTLARHSRNSGTNAGYDISVKTDAMGQSHHEHQQPCQQHSRYGSNTSASGGYPFGHSDEGIAQQTYHPNAASGMQRGQSPVPPYFGPRQYQSQSQPHGHQQSMGPSRPSTPSLGHCHSPGAGGLSISGCNPPQRSPGTNFGVYGPGGASEIVSEEADDEYNNSQRGSGMVPRPFSRDASLLAYPETPPGLSRPGT